MKQYQHLNSHTPTWKSGANTNDSNGFNRSISYSYLEFSLLSPFALSVEHVEV